MGTRRTDETLSVPEIPLEKTLKITSKFSDTYKDLIVRVEKMKPGNDDLVDRLVRYVGQVERNRYNLEVYLSIAYLERYFINTVLTLRDAETLMLRAQSDAAGGNFANAVSNLVEASNRVGSLISWGDWMWKNLTLTWEQSRFEKGRSVEGRDFVHVLDDVKDHFADRRKGLDYMIAPFQRIDLRGWRNRLNDRINAFAADKRVPVRGLEEKRLED
jgi:hypothetical protein